MNLKTLQKNVLELQIADQDGRRKHFGYKYPGFQSEARDKTRKSHLTDPHAPRGPVMIKI